MKARIYGFACAVVKDVNESVLRSAFPNDDEFSKAVNFVEKYDGEFTIYNGTVEVRAHGRYSYGVANKDRASQIAWRNMWIEQNSIVGHIDSFPNFWASEGACS